MVKALTRVENSPLALHLRPAVELNDEQLFPFCRLNQDLRIERTAAGDLEIMPPVGGGSSNRNAAITAQLWAWAREDGTGVVTDSSGGFILPNGAMRAPDAAWVRRSRLGTLTADQKERFLPLCPGFVIELRSPSDRLAGLREKLREYIDNGALLGWQIDTADRRVYVYRPHARVERLDQSDSLSGEPELPGFILDLKPIWDVGF